MQKIIPFKKEVAFKENVSEIVSISLEHTLHIEKDNLITGEFLVSGEYKVVDTSSVIDGFSFRLPFDIHMNERYDVSGIHIDIDDFYYEIKNNNTLLVNIDVIIDKIEEKIEEKELEEVRMKEENLDEPELKERPEVIEILNVLELAREQEQVHEQNHILEELEAKLVEEQIAESNLKVEEDRIIQEKRQIEESREPENIKIEETIGQIKKDNFRELEPTTIAETKQYDNEVSIEFLSDKIEENTKTTMEAPNRKEEMDNEERPKEGITTIFDDINITTTDSSTYHIYIVREEDTVESIIEKYSVERDLLENYNDIRSIKVGDKLVIPCVQSEKI